jgi:hypothetical protein
MKDKTLNTTSDPSSNIIDARAKLRPAPRLKVLKNPPLSPEEGKVLDRYIAARRREQAGKAEADALKGTVLRIVEARQQVARRGAVVSLDFSYKYHYSAATAVLEKTLSETRERERDNGTAKAITTATVAFEDVRRKDAERRAKLQQAV